MLEVLIEYDNQDASHFAVVEFRLPRLLLTLLGGAVLALAGFLFQVLTRNALADPYVLGTASGASLGANLAILGIIPSFIAGVYIQAVGAFIGAIAITLLVFFLARQKQGVNNTSLVLGGIAMAALITSCTSLLIYYSDSPERIRSMIFWSMGSFDRANWMDVVLLFVMLSLILTFLRVFHKEVGMMMLGEEMAQALGAKVKHIKFWVIISMCLIIGFLVSNCGPIGFVGLIIPHIVRSWKVRSLYQQLLLTAIIGGLFLLICEVASKLLYPPVGLPIGILTSLLGVPYFIYILNRSNYRF